MIYRFLTKNISIPAILVALFSFSSSALAKWNHLKLTLHDEYNPSNQIEVSLDYEVVSASGSLLIATPLYINVMTEKKVAKGRAVLRSMSFDLYQFSLADVMNRSKDVFLSNLGEQILEMRSNQSGVYASADYSVFMYGVAPGGSYKYLPFGVQELSVVLDGVWYKGRRGLDARFSIYDHYSQGR